MIFHLRYHSFQETAWPTKWKITIQSISSSALRVHLLQHLLLCIVIACPLVHFNPSLGQNSVYIRLRAISVIRSVAPPLTHRKTFFEWMTQAMTIHWQRISRRQALVKDSLSILKLVHVGESLEITVPSVEHHALFWMSKWIKLILSLYF